MEEKVIWSERRARFYNEALKFSDYPQKAMEALAPLAKGYRSVLDVGAGVGALTIPLARLVETVTALEPSKGMLGVLRRNLEREGIQNVVVIKGAWGEVELPPHDLLLVANVPNILEDIPQFVDEAQKIARRFIVLIQNVETGKDKFYFDELYPLLFRKEYHRKGDYLDTYGALHKLGIHADVKIIEYDFDQPFADLQEAILFWKEHLPLETADQEEVLKRFLEARLRPTPGGLLAPIHKKSAVISWSVKGIWPSHREGLPALGGSKSSRRLPSLKIVRARGRSDDAPLRASR